MKSKTNDRYWIKSGFINLLQSMLAILLSFGSFYLLVRYLDKDTYGAWTLFLGTTTLLEFVRNGLVQSALIKYLSSAPKDQKSPIISASFTIGTALTLLCIVINIAFAHILCNIWHSPQLLPLFYAYNIVFIFSGVLAQFACIEQAHFSYRGVFVSNLIRQGLFFVFILSCYLLKLQVSLMSFLYVQLAAVIVAMGTQYLFVRRYLIFTYTYSKDWILKLFHFGKFSFGTMLGSMIFNSIDQWMLGAFLSPAAAGAYNIAIRITNLVEVPTGAVATIVFPQSARRMETEGRDAIKYLYEKSVGTIMAILIPGLLFLYFFSDFVVDIIAGKKYAEAVPILQVTILYCLLIPYGRQFGTILDSIGKPRTTFSVVIISAGLNVVLNYFFIHRYGVIGAAYGTLLSNIIGFIIGQFILRRELKVNLQNTVSYALQFYPEFITRYMKFR